MAGFQSPNNIPQFTPYISTVNSDLYGQAILKRQDDYNQGVQRTQQYIDNITGLQVGRAEDHEYLQAQTSKLKSQIEGLAGADYALSDTIRQVGSIASTIYNDKRVQKDVISASNAKDMEGQLAKAQEKGTYANANAWQLQKRLDAWRSGGADASLAKTSYTDNYNMQPDFSKYMKDVNKHIIVDYSKPKDANGNPVAYVIEQNERKYLSPQEVKMHFNDFVSTNNKAQTQLSIDKDYYLDHVQPEQGLAIYQNTLKGNVSSLEDSITKLQTEAKLKGKSNEEINAYNDRIKSYQNLRDNYTTMLQNPSSYTENYREVLGEVYSDSVATQSSRRFVVDERSSQLTPDLIWQGQLKASEAQLARDKFSYEQVKDQRDYELKAAKLNPSVSGFNDIVLPSSTGTDYKAADYEKGLANEGLRLVQVQANLINTALGGELTNGFMKKLPNGGFVVTDKATFEQVMKQVDDMHEHGYFKGKDQYQIDAFTKYYEGVGDESLSAVRGWTTRRQDWQNEKSTKFMPEFTKAITKSGLKDNDVVFRDKNTTITNADLVNFVSGKYLSPEKQKIIETQGGNSSGEDFNIFSKKGITSIIMGAGDNAASSEADTKLSVNLAKVRDLYGNSVKSSGLNDRARELNNSIAIPSITIGAGTDEDSKTRRAKVINPLTAYISQQKRAGDEPGAVENYLANVNGIKKKNDEGAMVSEQANIRFFQQDGKYYTEIVNAKDNTKVEVDPRIVQTYAPELMAPKELKNIQSDLTFNMAHGLDETPQYGKVLYQNQKDPGYKLNYKIKKANGMFYPMFEYKQAAADALRPTPLKGASRGMNSLQEAYDFINKMTSMTRQQFETMLDEEDDSRKK